MLQTSTLSHAPTSKLQLRRIGNSAVVLANILVVFVACIPLEVCNVFTVHHAGDVVRLPLLEREASSRV